MTERVGRHRSEDQPVPFTSTLSVSVPSVPEEVLYSFTAAEELVRASLEPNGIRFGEPVSRHRLPPPSQPVVDTSRTVSGVTGFYDDIHGQVYMSEAFEVVRLVSNGISQYGAGEKRRTLFEAPIQRWRESDGLSDFMASLRLLYDAHEPSHAVRNDLKTGDEYGTDVYVGYSSRQPFLLVERAVIAETLAARQYAARRLEFVDISHRSTMRDVLNELSLMEWLRVCVILGDMSITDEQRTAALQAANRQTVRSEADVPHLVLQLAAQEAKSKQGWRAVLGRLAHRQSTKDYGVLPLGVPEED